MFDIGFSEVLLIFVLALIVLGPEKLPKVAAQVGRWIGRARGMARQFREQLEEEVNLEETRKAQSAANRTPTPEPTGAASQPSPHTASVSPTAGTPAPPSSTSAATGSPAAESDEAAICTAHRHRLARGRIPHRRLARCRIDGVCTATRTRTPRHVPRPLFPRPPDRLVGPAHRRPHQRVSVGRTRPTGLGWRGNRTRQAPSGHRQCGVCSPP